MTWLEVCQDRSLANLPFKIELNRHGQVIMSPHRKEHGAYQSRIAALLLNLKPAGEVVSECAVETDEGTRVADVAWISRRLWRELGDSPSCTVSPEICVEVWSASNTEDLRAEKRRLYFEAGAREVWECDGRGQLRFFEARGEIKTSRLVPEFPRRLRR